MRLHVLFAALAVMAAGTVAAQSAPFQRVERSKLGTTRLNPHFGQDKFLKAKAKFKASELPEGTVLYEDFEEWDNEDTWAPEGWTFDHKKLPAGHPGWKAYPYDPYDPISYPSTSYIFFKFQEPVDEWFISPEFVAQEGMILQADFYNAATYYFDIEAEMFTSNIKSINKVNDFIVNITTDGGATWTPLFSAADQILSYNFTRASDIWALSGWQTLHLSLDEYVGKTAKIAFQIVGDPVGMPDEPDSQSSGVDNIMVGYPKVEVSYQRPLGALFYGLTNKDLYVPGTFMVVPAHHPVVFPNTSNTMDADFVWAVDHTDGELTSYDKEALTVTYGTNHETEETSRNNIYKAPILTGSGDYFSTTQFSLPGFVQAGGRGEYQIHYTDDETSEWLQLGLAVSDPQEEYSSTFADILLPYCGYNQESDRFWTTRAFGISNQEYEKSYRGDKNNWSELHKYGNFYYTNDYPVVIEGIRTNAYGRGYGYNGSMPNAKFTAEIFYLNEKFEISETPQYTFECTGANIEIWDRQTTNHLISLNFPVETPIVISNKDCPAFLIAISGFHDPENIEYFSPELSAYDNPDGLALGWVASKTCWGGYELPYSWGPVAYLAEDVNEPEGERYRSFYIMIDGCLPWLVGDDAVTVDPGQTVSLQLDSYYDASELKISGVPSWLEVKASGRYGTAKIDFTSKGTAEDFCNLVITAPGVEKNVRVGGTAGIGSVEAASGDGPVEYFNLQGIRIDNPSPGSIVIKRQGGVSSKVIL